MRNYKIRPRAERRIFFPWEGRGGLRRFLARGRFAPLFWALAFGVLIFALFSRQRYAAGVRRTQLALSAVQPGVERYLLQHEGQCPQNLEEILPLIARSELPSDGWGRGLRLVCPSVRPGVSYVLMSDGPDGKAGGLDRIEY